MPSDKARDDLPNHMSGLTKAMLKRLIEQVRERRKQRDEQPRRVRARAYRPNRNPRPRDAAEGITRMPPTEKSDTPRSLPDSHRIPQQRWPMHDEQH